MADASDYTTPATFDERFSTPPPSPSADSGSPSSAPLSPPTGISQSEIDSLLKQRTEATDTAIGTIKDLGKLRSELLTTPTPHPAHAKLQDIPKAPQDNYRDVFKESSPGLVFATLMGSLMSRRHGMGAMAAATGYIEGFQKGDKEVIERNRQKWSDSVDQVIKQNAVEKDRYDMVWNDTKLSMQDKQAKLQAIAASIGDQQTITALQTGNIDFAKELIHQRDQAAQKLFETKVKYGSEGGLSDQDVDFAARQALAKGGVLPPSMFRGMQGPQDRRRVMARMREVAEEQGIKPEQLAQIEQKFRADTAGLTSEARTAGTAAANIELIIRNAHAAIPQALAMSDKLDRTRFVPLNKLLQASEASVSDPDLKEFRLANLQLAELWARAMNPRGVMRESDRSLALDMLSTADSKETYKRVIGQLKAFLEREQESVRGFREGKPMGGGANDAASMSDEDLKKKLGIK